MYKPWLHVQLRLPVCECELMCLKIVGGGIQIYFVYVSYVSQRNAFERKKIGPENPLFFLVQGIM